MNATPSLPKKGGQPKASSPLDSTIPPSLREFLVSLLMIYHILEDT